MTRLPTKVGSHRLSCSSSSSLLSMIKMSTSSYIVSLTAIQLFILCSLVIPLTSSQHTPHGIKECPHPAVPLYARVWLSDENNIRPGSTASYKCDDGYELFGESVRTCNFDGKWSGEVPYCAVNVAYGKPTNQSSTARGGDSRNANDGDTTVIHENKYCTETKTENSPWWQVDLLQPYQVRVVRIVTRGCCGHQPLHDLEIRVGNSSHVQGNRLCAWYPGTLGDGITKDLHCAHAITGRYVFIQMVGVEASLSLCEVFVFTTKEFSPDRCGNQMEDQQLTTFNETCYELQTSQGGSFMEADSYCKSRGGYLVNSVTNVTHNFLFYELERVKNKLKSKLVWLGARREQTHNHPAFHRSRSATWSWVSGAPITSFLWADDQPNNYNGQQNCIVLDGGRRWLWNDVTCDLDYLPWICQYKPSNCGSPDKLENSTIKETDYRVGRTITYSCPTGHKIDGPENRTCLNSGFWSDQAPSCKFVDCGPLNDILHGRVFYSRTSFNATARYVCDENYAVVGNETRTCLGNGTWSLKEPKCLYKWCPQLINIPNGMLNVTNRTENGLATYECHKGHQLIGNKTRKCQLGGRWTDEEPFCKYIDCGIPLEVRNGRYTLLNGTTTYQSMVQYECFENYALEGNKTRNCTEHATWAGGEPICKLIDCGRPEVSAGVKLLNDTFTVHLEVEYKCEPGYKHIDGDQRRTCNSDGKWSGKPPRCKYIDCGRVQTILKGEVKYENGTGVTYLGSKITYSCSSGYKLVGSKSRTCNDDGRWTESTPRCEEIRCVPPEIPRNSSVVYSGNDRSTSDSFIVGATVQYRCATGHIVRGHGLRTCEANGSWSDSPPTCVYTDCGFPYPLINGRWQLTTNSTHYGSTVEYTCDPHFKLNGPQRRICLENGTWSQYSPTCDVVTCPKPDTKDDKTIVEGAHNYAVGSKVTYTCHHGYELVGHETRFCQQNGEWSNDVPYCRVTDCGRPPVTPNGRGILVNGSTHFGSFVEYHCMPDFKLVGESLRRCLASGEWSGSSPRCLELSLANEIERNHYESSPDGHAADLDIETSKAMGIGIAIGSGALLIFVFIIAFVCLKAKKKQPVKGPNETVHQMPHNQREPDKDTAQAMSYSRLSLESEAANNLANTMANTSAIRQNPNGLVTFCSPHHQHHQPQPLYANMDLNGYRAANTVSIRTSQPHSMNGATTPLSTFQTHNV